MKRLSFISIKDAFFHLDGDSCNCILATIHSHQFVRKLFSEGKLSCFSRDGLFSTSRDPCSSCEHPQCRRWLRLFLKINGKNYALDLPQRLIPAYQLFLESARIKITRQPLNVPATLSLQSKDGAWVFSIHKA